MLAVLLLLLLAVVVNDALLSLFRLFRFFFLLSFPVLADPLRRKGNLMVCVCICRNDPDNVQHTVCGRHTHTLDLGQRWCLEGAGRMLLGLN